MADIYCNCWNIPVPFLVFFYFFSRFCKIGCRKKKLFFNSIGPNWRIDLLNAWIRLQNRINTCINSRILNPVVVKITFKLLFKLPCCKLRSLRSLLLQCTDIDPIADCLFYLRQRVYETCFWNRLGNSCCIFGVCFYCLWNLFLKSTPDFNIILSVWVVTIAIKITICHYRVKAEFFRCKAGGFRVYSSLRFHESASTPMLTFSFIEIITPLNIEFKLLRCTFPLLERLICGAFKNCVEI